MHWKGVAAVSRTMLLLDTPGGHLGELAETFRTAGGPDCRIEIVTELAEMMRKLRGQEPYDLVVLDYLAGGGTGNGREALATVRGYDEQLPVIAVAERGDVDLAAEAVSAGATDFLVRGGHLKQRVSTLLGKVRQLLELIDRNRLLHEQNLLLKQADRRRLKIIGDSPQMAEVLMRVERVASIPRPVLIVGERGTGKELVARAIHDASDRPTGPFVVVNCAAFADSLLEGELFGHEKGSFTGAESLVHGKFGQSDGGTLFLDEIGNMSLPFQQKILRVVEYGTFTRVGGTREVRTNCRIVAATNADLEDLIRRGKFLQDLYDRLAFEIVHVPPLRERQGDIDLLARYFLNEFMREIPALGGKRLSARAIEVLRKHSFPGNVREMKNIIERSAYRDTTNEITPEDIGMLPEAPAPWGNGAGGDVRSFEEKVHDYQGQLIGQAMVKCNSNQAAAARSLGMSYHRFRYHLKKHGDQ